MKICTLFVILFSLNNRAFPQKAKLSFFKDSKLSFVSTTINKDPDKLPLFSFTILNKTKTDVIFNKLILNLTYFKKYPRSSSSNNIIESKELRPIAYWDLEMPDQLNSYVYTPPYPITITSKEAATIQIRVFRHFNGKAYVPSQFGYYKFNLIFLTYDNKGVKTEELTLGESL